MKLWSVLNKRNLVLLALLVCAFTMASISVAAQNLQNSDATQAPPKVVRTVYQGETHVGRCCKLWDASITVTEPQDKLVPIVVTFSVDYRATAPFYAGLRLNDGVCAFYGPANVPTFSPENQASFSPATFRWVIMPGDYKLAKGPNVVTVCGGGVDFFAENDTITLGFNTLSAELVK
ncbi:MAG: hypothetical protein ROO76_02230 [Terriglobia bacterium]|nr:hypothetical protein [Terriglobia bacterium]